MEPILLIDDDVELCSMLTDYLGRHGYHVTEAHHGKTGLEKALGGSYAMLLLDVMLPGMDGFEVLRRLRAAGSPMNVLLLTARGEDVDRIVGMTTCQNLSIHASCWPGSGPFCAGAGT
jgi:DNA-binding response OmpR family regulator